MFHVREICKLKVRFIHLRAAYFTYYTPNIFKISYLAIIKNFNINKEAVKVLISNI